MNADHAGRPAPVVVPVAPYAMTAAGWALTVGVPFLLLLGTFLPDPDGTARTRALASLLAFVLAGVFWLAPRRLRYELTPSELVIRRLLGHSRLPLAVVTARRTAGRLGLRVLGTGLPGYLTGRYTLSGDARTAVIAAASRPEDGVLIEWPHGAYFVTPADPPAFLRELRRRGVSVTA